MGISTIWFNPDGRQAGNDITPDATIANLLELPTAIDDIIECETVFPQRFAGVEKRDFGLLFYTPDIPDSHDGNHAHILRPCDIGEAVAEIESFYQTRNITPRINHLSKPGHGCGKQLRDTLEARGYKLVGQDNLFYVHRLPSQIKPTAKLSIRRVAEPLQDLMEMITQTNCERAMKVISKSLAWDDYHLLVGFLDEKLVSIAALERSGQISRVDDVMTHPAFRSKGYCRAVIDELIRYHSRVFGGDLSLFTDNPTAAPIYEKAGFVKLDGKIEFWSAWLD